MDLKPEVERIYQTTLRPWRACINRFIFKPERLNVAGETL